MSAPQPGQHPQQPPYPGQQPYPPGRRTGFGIALLAALVWAAVNLVLSLTISGPPPSAAAAGAFVGALLIPTLVAALATWLIARRRSPSWRFPLLVLLALPFYLVIRVLAAAGSAAG